MSGRFRETRSSMKLHRGWREHVSSVICDRTDGGHSATACNYPSNFSLHGTRSSSIIIYPSLNIHSIILTTIWLRCDAFRPSGFKS